MHLNSMLLFQKYVQPLLRPEQRLLEVGPNLNPISDFQQAAVNGPRQWETIDLFAHPRVTYQATGEYSFPLPDNTFDIVFSAQVIEHVRKPWVWMKELARVCKPGGQVITINPVSWPYHEAPVDCWRIYPEGHRAMAEDCGLTVEMATFDCLELGGYKRRRYGTTVTRRTWWSVAIRKALRMRVEGAFDTICIARKN
jgi:SAM-dependent methyltransferase